VTRVKICGCMRVADAIAAAEAGADFIGMIFADSRRRVDVETAYDIARAVGAPLAQVEQEAPPSAPDARTPDAWLAHGAAALDRLLARKRPLVAGVFEDAPPEEINEIADEVGLDLVQLAGNEPWSDALVLNRLAVKVVRPAAGADAAGVLACIEPGTAVACMLDDSRGTGTLGDHALAAAFAARAPVWLAGGLTPGTVGAVVRHVRPWLVDVSSGVEADGAKDPAKIRAFVAAVREVTA